MNYELFYIYYELFSVCGNFLSRVTVQWVSGFYKERLRPLVNILVSY